MHTLYHITKIPANTLANFMKSSNLLIEARLAINGFSRRDKMKALLKLQTVRVALLLRNAAVLQQM